MISQVVSIHFVRVIIIWKL